MPLPWPRREETITTLEDESRAQLDLTPRPDGAEDSADVVSEMPHSIFEDRIPVPAEGKRALGITRYGKIWMIEQIVGFGSKRDPDAFG